MNILILSASTGGGHMRASKAIENYMIQQGENINVEIVDSLLYISPILNKTITSGYLYLATKTPKLYGKLYDLTNKEHKLANFVARLNNIFANKLMPLIEDFKPDVIITTHIDDEGNAKQDHKRKQDTLDDVVSHLKNRSFLRGQGGRVFNGCAAWLQNTHEPGPCSFAYGVPKKSKI